MPQAFMLQPLLYMFSESQVWRVDGDSTNEVPVAEPIIFYSGDCYIVQYRYPTKVRDENLFYAWLGKSSLLVRTTYTCKIIFLKFVLFLTFNYFS